MSSFLWTYFAPSELFSTMSYYGVPAEAVPRIGQLGVRCRVA